LRRDPLNFLRDNIRLGSRGLAVRPVAKLLRLVRKTEIAGERFRFELSRRGRAFGWRRLREVQSSRNEERFLNEGLVNEFVIDDRSCQQADLRIG
jgi:hypothetical protein